METKQTAITELSLWIKERNDNCRKDHEIGHCNYYTIRILEIIEAKVNSMVVIEKEQIKDAYLLGLIHPLEIEASRQSEQYYQETYGNGH